ncbi:hypothetical protein TrST_g13833 [Triparma strigata]|uniref:2-(3-amino-3-carboxypropyl)histidine synthase subunit 2 n=1 Tax=Triparma strigata TaxID=1606541 RepID=A0A9W7EVI3_9STRA|nr:hypothetical protein TrST_g13833 [Triparma strigata]
MSLNRPSDSPSETAVPRLEMNDGSRIFSSIETNVTVSKVTSGVSSEDYQKCRKSGRPEEYSIEEYYEISSTVKKILSLLSSSPSPPPYLKLGLQFPDSLLPDSSPVSLLLQNSLSSLSPLIFILGDTTYGECCVDVVSGKHLNADVIVHYGNSCLSKQSEIPCINVFGRVQVDVEDFVEKVKGEVESGEDVAVTYDVRFSYVIDEVITKLKERVGGVNFIKGELNMEEGMVLKCGEKEGECGTLSQGCCGSSPLPTPPQIPTEPESPSTNPNIIGGLTFPPTLSLPSTTILHLHSTNLKQLTNILMKTSSSKRHLTYTSSSKSLTPGVPKFASRSLNRRFYLTRKLLTTQVFGIVIATLSVSNFSHVVKRVKAVIESKGRTCYVFMVGKVNVAKLGNYGEIEAFVLVACPENSLLESSDFHVPVVTPWELEVGLGVREWGGYTVEFEDYLKEDQEGPSESQEEEGDEPIFDVVTGTYVERIKNEIDLTKEVGGGQVTTFKSEAGKFLNSREYTGLESNVGASEVKKAVKGQVGIASEYDGKDQEVKKSKTDKNHYNDADEDSDSSGEFVLGGITSMTMDTDE